MGDCRCGGGDARAGGRWGWNVRFGETEGGDGGGTRRFSGTGRGGWRWLGWRMLGRGQRGG